MAWNCSIKYIYIYIYSIHVINFFFMPNGDGGSRLICIFCFYHFNDLYSFSKSETTNKILMTVVIVQYFLDRSRFRLKDLCGVVCV